MSSRIERVADLLRGELANILQQDMKDPRVRLATVSHIVVSRDLSHARVLVSVLGDEEDRESCVRVLERAKGFIRSTLAGRARLRTVPLLNFELDRGAEHAVKISQLLEDLDVPGEGS